MRIDMSSVPENGTRGTLKISANQSGFGAFAAALNEDDSVKAVVLSASGPGSRSADKGTVVLRAEDGQVFRARLEAGVKLSQGDAVLLEVTGKEAGTVYLSIRGRAAPAETEMERQAALTKDFSDKSLSPLAAKLADMNMPATEETASAMREILVRYPGATLEEAAFLASNKLGGDDSLVRAALALLSDGEKTDAMIERLLSLLRQPSGDAHLAGLGADGGEIAGRLFRADMQPNFPLARIIPHNPTVLQTGNDENVEKNYQILNYEGENVEITQQLGIADMPTAATSAGRAAPHTPIDDASGDIQGNPVNRAAAGFASEETRALAPDARLSDARALADGQSGLWASHATPLQERNAQATSESDFPNTPARRDATGSPILDEPLKDTPPAPPAGNGASVTQLPSAHSPDAPPAAQPGGNSLSSLLSPLSSPPSLLCKTPTPAALSTLSSPPAAAVLLEKLFTRIGKGDQDAAGKLRIARETMLDRLSLIEQAMTRAAPSAKTEMLDQMRKLTDHVRLLNSIDQFAYMQLPVSLNGERKAAEVYLFRRKGSKKRFDPENINVLLALDLEYMGHWEGLINIRNKDVSIRMQVPGAPEKEFLGRNTVKLHEMLAESGFRLVSADITYSTEQTTLLTALSVLTKNSASRIDYVV